METFKNLAIGIAALAIATCAGITTHYVGSVTGRMHGTLDNLDDATGSMKTTSKVVGDYLAFETEQLRSDEYQRMIKASFQTPAIFNASGRSLNTQVLPAARDELKALGGATNGLNDLIAELREKTVPAATDDLNELNGMLAGLSDLEQRVGLSIGETNKLIAEVSRQTGLTTDAVIKRLQDPKIDATLANLADATGHVNGIVANGEEASKKWPAITEAINHASQVASKAAKFYWAARIVSLIVGALPLP
ncbi:MAG TPA: hypothetical protein VI756_04980 [Blastocatellia bacterium]